MRKFISPQTQYQWHVDTTLWRAARGDAGPILLVSSVVLLTTVCIQNSLSSPKCLPASSLQFSTLNTQKLV